MMAYRGGRGGGRARTSTSSSGRCWIRGRGRKRVDRRKETVSLQVVYGKLFKSLYEGSLRGKSHEILVFTNMIGSKDKNHCVDKTQLAIAQEVGLTEEEVKEAILNLEAPDPRSRTPDNDGRRIERLNDHRDWGWIVLNGEKYKRIQSEEDRREANKIYQATHRARKSEEKMSEIRQQMSAMSDSGEAMSALSAHIDVDIQQQQHREWMEKMRAKFLSKGLSMEKEFSRCKRWYEKRGMEITKDSFERWESTAKAKLDMDVKPETKWPKGPTR